jgi:Anti-sigma-K factor rskA/Putative zinc-finger
VSAHEAVGGPMAHADANDALPALALGALDAAERERMLAHVAGCSACVAELAALRECASAVAMAAPRAPHADDASRRSTVRERLMARAAAESGARRAATSPAAGPDYVPPLAVVRGDAPPVLAPRAARGPARWPVWTALAASLLLAAVLGVQARRVSGERDVLRDRVVAMSGDARRDADARRAEIEERDRTLAALTGRDVKVVELTSGAPTAPWARMFWDRGANRWLMFAGNLPRSAAGRTYELWIIADGKKIPAGTFEPNARGDAVMRAEFALDGRVLQALAVTAEPAGGVNVPTGPVVIAGTVVASR